MKRYVFILTTLLSVLLISCEDNFNPLGEYSERYTLNCVIKPDTSFQVATVTKSYLEGIDPYDNTNDPFVENVLLRLWYNDEVYIFKDSIIARENTERYDSPVKIYYLENFNPPPGSDLEIEALLPNGRRLNSTTELPARPRKVSGATSIIPPVDSDVIYLQWENETEGLTYHPRLTVNYKQTENGVVYEKSKLVPVDYYDDNGEMKPLYPLASNQRNLSISMDNFNRFMLSFAEGVENKRSLEFLFIAVEILAFDKNLSLYYASSNTVLDEYSIKLDEADFSNIDGGFGVFGAYTKGAFAIKFTTEYLENFGYRNGFN